MELSQPHRVLEIASGYGQHALCFARAMPWIDWQPSDIDPQHLNSITSYVDEACLPNLHRPLHIDVSAPLTMDCVDALVSINLLHICAWEVGAALLANAGRILNDGGVLLFYGPFIRGDVDTAPTNLMFDQRLKKRNPQWGIPRLERVQTVATTHGLTLKRIYEMPANNLMVIFQKSP